MEKYNGIWRIKAKLLQEEKQKIKEQKIKNNYSYSCYFKKSTCEAR